MGEKIKDSSKKQNLKEKQEFCVEANEQDVKLLLSKSEISLLLDNYDDIFSDFDPRPYSQRSLSDDFLAESKKVARDKIGNLELRFLVPAKMRKPEVESMIKKRLRDHFKRHVSMMENEAKKIRLNGAFITFAGFILMLIATSINFLDLHNFIFSFAIIVLDPAGWFIVWFGLDEIFYKAREKKPELDFYRKMVTANISFSSY